MSTAFNQGTLTNSNKKRKCHLNLWLRNFILLFDVYTKLPMTSLVVNEQWVNQAV